MEENELVEIEKPIGDFLMAQNDLKPLMTPNGIYYSWSDVYQLLKRYKDF